MNIGQVKAFTIYELAKSCGKSSFAIRKLEERGILPKANIRSEYILIKNKKPWVSDANFTNYQKVFARYRNQKIEPLTEEELFILDDGLKDRQVLQGTRLYSDFIFYRLSEQLKKITRGSKVSEAQKEMLLEIFAEENIYLQKNY